MPLLDALHVYCDAAFHSAAVNMAVDEALLKSASVPSLRFYGWREPSISFGYFGRFADVQPHHATHELVRRWTGGGIVYHGEDLTYSLVLPAPVATRFPSSRMVYAQVHGAIREALSARLPAALANSASPKISEACFANPVEADVLLGGKKIAGAAQRRTRAGLLHQGSIQCESLPAGFRESFARAMCPSFERRQLGSVLLGNAARLARDKYGTCEWLHAR